MDEICHASNRRGITECGDTTPGRLQANTEKYPERWNLVTCPVCKAKKQTRVVDQSMSPERANAEQRDRDARQARMISSFQN